MARSSHRCAFVWPLPQYESWLKDEGNGPLTVKKYVRVAVHFGRVMDVAAFKATTADVVRWRKIIATVTKGSVVRDAAPSSINVRIAALRTFFRFCTETKLRRDDPTKASGLKILPLPLRKPKPITRVNMKAVYDTVYAAPPSAIALQDRAILEVLYGSGLRRDEVACLLLVNFEVRDQLRVIGKGNKERITIVTKPEREAIVAWTISHLGDSRTRKIVRSINADAAFDDLVRRFPTRPVFYSVEYEAVSHRPMAELADPGQAIAHRCTVWFKRAGIAASAHRFRHSFATVLLSAGATHKEIGGLLGHGDERSTSVYTGTEDSLFTRLQALHPRAV
jgi:integrase/recombinase XerD